MLRWDIFCKVVDNYGDIGVCWRLARQLADEHGVAVRLWVDRLSSFAQLCPAVCASAELQHVGRVEIRRWQTDSLAVEAADVAVEAFGCELPDTYVAAMARRGMAPVWINLEYLSAEDWVEGCHRLPSLRTNWPLTKHFFFPGFTARTGGLLRERNLLADRAAFDTTAEADFWRSLDVPARSKRELRVALFCYRNKALPALLQTWADGSSPVSLMVTHGLAADRVAGWCGEPLSPGTPLLRSSLTVYPLPLLPQSTFDRLLWACDVNFVRGEDSFVRAQWAGRPFVWQIYPQADDAHLVKLEAFLGRFLDGCENSTDVRRLWRAWNGGGQIASAWADFAACRAAIERHGKVWANHLDQMGNLADNLISFVREIQSRQEH